MYKFLLNVLLIVLSIAGMLAAVSIFIFAPHEFGHLLAGLAMGFDVTTFSIGLGDELIGFNAFGIHWQLAPIPLGAYVELNTCCVDGDPVNLMEASHAGMVSHPAVFFSLLVGPIVNIALGLIALKVIVNKLHKLAGGSLTSLTIVKLELYSLFRSLIDMAPPQAYKDYFEILKIMVSKTKPSFLPDSPSASVY